MSVASEFPVFRNYLLLLFTLLADIFRKFNPQVKGYSVCQSSEDNVDKSWFNVAQPGGTSE